MFSSQDGAVATPSKLRGHGRFERCDARFQSPPDLHPLGQHPKDDRRGSNEDWFNGSDRRHNPGPSMMGGTRKAQID